ncbi:MAG: CD3072 family TudS-related putative desulfidase [Candidatus Hodarchaeota archaeon]
MKRGKRVVVVSHCVLNQNARVKEAASHPGGINEIIEVLLKNNIGIIQLPCAEVGAFGMDRWAAPKRQFDTPVARKYTKRVLEAYIDELSEFKKQNYEVVAVIGIEGSPFCGIYRTSYQEAWQGGFIYNKDLRGASLGLTDGRGILMEIFIEELKKIGLDVPKIEVSDRRLTPGKTPKEVANKLTSIIKRSTPSSP